MIELLMSLFSVAGSAGFGSILKLFSGLLSGRREHKLATIAAMSRSDESFQAIFKPGEQSAGSNTTRRILGVMLIGMICFIGCYSVVNSTNELITFIIPEAKEGHKFLFGLIVLKSTKDVTVLLTLGHLAIMSLNIGAMVAGFYFTPGGRR